MSLRAANMTDFQHILRVLNTNVDGREKVVVALTAIRGIGRRISALICKKADIDTDKRAGELTADEISKVRPTSLVPLQTDRAFYCALLCPTRAVSSTSF